jgi:hypothetical protein
MNMEPMGSADQPKSRRWLIIVVVVLVVCCLCLAAGLAGWYLYTNGDQLLGLTARGLATLA